MLRNIARLITLRSFKLLGFLGCENHVNISVPLCQRRQGKAKDLKEENKRETLIP